MNFAVCVVESGARITLSRALRYDELKLGDLTFKMLNTQQIPAENYLKLGSKDTLRNRIKKSSN